MYKQTDTVTIGEIDPTTETILNARAVRPNPNAPGEIVFQSRSKTVDGNPFGLSLSLSVGDVAGLKDNTFTLISAVPHQPSGVFLIQPWELAYDSRGWLSGQLVPLIQPNILNQTPKYIQSPERDRLSRRDLNAIAQKLTNLAKAGAAELSFKLDLSSLLTHQN
ncbi:MAG: hypothetical protein J0L70_20375 [Leptolyngbya sp. UWPOB_LEPTO1]|uniref:hypothetical protein n=1 Tax=Leptolyngbya sp. UWPOB_LEPTO1 TaxID=2815653 RepID=UPI001AC19E5E|nr:hypothetical protein [Leptolyngbya sp. UWPOB_LEPTO1]MBN8562897.1 hypothetical protein [Leptolyngbya sp. UWPOB_LEPTO1]